MAPIKILACQAQSINHYKDVRIKVLKCCANICFNRQCLTKKVILKYANIRIPYTSPATKRYIQSDGKMRLNFCKRKKKN